MNKASHFRDFLNAYENYINQVLKPEHRRIRAYFDRWREPYFWERYAKTSGSPYPNPIRSVFTRIKRPEKVIDKILRKPGDYPASISPESFYKMHDCIGVRIIVYFLSQLPYIDRELRCSNSIEISEEIAPEAYLSRDLLNRFGLSHITHKEKESGYASVHYVIRLRPNKRRSDYIQPWFEIQVRTLAQELWSEMEHILAYKSTQKASFSAKRRFQILSSQINSIDEHFNLLYDELIQDQEKNQFEENENLRPENLPNTLSLIGVRCAQQDIDTIISILNSRGVKTIKDLLILANPKRLETIRNTFITVTGRSPDNFELITCLASLKGLLPEENESQHVKSQIEFSRFWRKFRKQFIMDKNNPRSYK